MGHGYRLRDSTLQRALGAVFRGCIFTPQAMGSPSSLFSGQSNETCILESSPWVLHGSQLEGAGVEAGEPERRLLIAK